MAQKKPLVLMIDDNGFFAKDFRWWNKQFGNPVDYIHAEPIAYEAQVHACYDKGTPPDVIVIDYFNGADAADTFLGKIAERHHATTKAPLPPVILQTAATSSDAIKLCNHIRENTDFKNVFLPKEEGQAPAFHLLELIAKLCAFELKETEKVVLERAPEALALWKKIEEKCAVPQTTLSGVLQAFTAFEATPLSITGSVLKETIQSLIPHAHSIEIAEKAFLETIAPPTEQDSYVEFLQGTGHCLCGKAAYSVEQALELRKEFPNTPLIYVTPDAFSDTHQLLLNHKELFQGVVIVGRTAFHFLQVANGLGLSALTFDEQEAEKLGIEWIEGDDDSLLLDITTNNGASLLAAGDDLTLDTHNNRLYLGLKEITPPNPPPSLYRFAAYVQKVVETIPPPKALMPGNRPLHFVPIVSQPHEMKVVTDTIGLMRMEDFFLERRANQALLAALKNPSGQNLVTLRHATAGHLRRIFEGRAVDEITIRLMDFKADALLSSPQEEAFFLRKFNMTSLRGFALSGVVPEVYAAQIEGVFDIIPSALTKDGNLIFAVPMTETTEHIARTKEIIRSATSGHPLAWRIAPVIETQRGATAAAEVAPLCIRASDETPYHPHILFGTNDLVEEELGCKRNETGKIRQWIDEYHHPLPFQRGTTVLDDTIKNVIKETTRSCRLRPLFCICGEHATSAIFCSQTDWTGLDRMCVPAHPRYLTGLATDHNLLALIQGWDDNPRLRMPQP